MHGLFYFTPTSLLDLEFQQVKTLLLSSNYIERRSDA